MLSLFPSWDHDIFLLININTLNINYYSSDDDTPLVVCVSKNSPLTCKRNLPNSNQPNRNSM